MRTFLGFVLLTFTLCSCATAPGPATKLEKANVLPLALNDHFQFRKVKLYYFGNNPIPETQSEIIQFEMRRVTWGALNSWDVIARQGNYFTFFWRATERADVTVRLEYRQAALGSFVMAQERYYPEAKRSYQSEFTVTGDDYMEFGRVTSWRALLIVDGRIVALKQSFIWR